MDFIIFGYIPKLSNHDICECNQLKSDEERGKIYTNKGLALIEQPKIISQRLLQSCNRETYIPFFPWSYYRENECEAKIKDAMKSLEIYGDIRIRKYYDEK